MQSKLPAPHRRRNTQPVNVARWLLLCVYAFAVTPLSNAQTPPQSAPPSISQPSGQIGAPITPQHGCANFVPGGVIPPLHDDKLLISVQIGIDGEIRNPTIFRSSGDAELDKAILACADGNHLRPLTSDGALVQATWVLAYTPVPQMHQDGFSPARPSGPRHLCLAIPVASLVRLHSETDVVIQFRIGLDGSTKDLKLLRSAGDDGLDQTILKCVAHWKYYPVLQNGQPMEIDWLSDAKLLPPRF